jgi:hypothetical protein
MTTDVRIIAIDCATKPKRIGMCAGWARDGALFVEEVVGGASVESMSTWLAERADVADDVILGLDAPLGWPALMRDGLAQHRAGDWLPGEANNLFRRATDTFVHQSIGKLPLDVGADRIARTAHSALDLLHDVRAKSRHDFPVPNHAFAGGSAAIETYPGGTLRSGPWNDRGYKGRDGPSIRANLLEELSGLVTISDMSPEILENDDMFDAIIAALGAVDYVAGRCFDPYDASLADREGWIWVRRPESSA